MKKVKQHMWEFCSLLFCVADWFVQPAFEREIKTGTTLIPAQTLHVAVQEQLHFQTILSSPRLAWSSEKLFPTRFPGEPGRSSPLPALHHLVQPCSCRVFWREDPALSPSGNDGAGMWSAAQAKASSRGEVLCMCWLQQGSGRGKAE